MQKYQGYREWHDPMAQSVSPHVLAPPSMHPDRDAWEEYKERGEKNCLAYYHRDLGCHPGLPTEQWTLPVELEYLAELDNLREERGVPDGPGDLCWGCRSLYHWGKGPQAQVLRRLVGGK